MMPYNYKQGTAVKHERRLTTDSVKPITWSDDEQHLIHRIFTWQVISAGMCSRTPWSRPRPEVFEVEAKVRSFQIKVTYAYEILHD